MSDRCQTQSSRRVWRPRAIGLVLLAALSVPLSPASAVGRVDGDAASARSPAAPAADAGPTNVLPPDEAWTVTLLTGDVVDVASDAEGRVSARVRMSRDSLRTMRLPNGEIYVIPTGVTPLLETVLDRELFNVTDLIRQGYDDASSQVIPLIVQHDPAADVDVAATLFSSAGERSLPSISAASVEVPKANTPATGERLRSASADAPAAPMQFDGVTEIWLDRRLHTLHTSSAEGSGAGGETRSVLPGGAPATSAELDRNLVQIGVEQAWAAGLDGEGTRVGILDTGIDAKHPDLVGQVVAVENFARHSSDTVDRFGHGTHVAAIVAGTGAAAGGARSGVAPAADLVVGKVLDDSGSGIESDIIAGMEWAAPQTDVINMSLGGAQPSDGSDPFSLAVDHLSDQYGTLFVVAAGNSGPESVSVGVPAAADRALTVGAVDFEDQVTEWSSRGPLAGSFELKPEVVAPGAEIVAARAAHTSMGTPVGQRYTAASGTSMATPHVAGSAALLAEQHPDWSAEQLKKTIVAPSPLCCPLLRTGPAVRASS